MRCHQFRRRIIRAFLTASDPLEQRRLLSAVAWDGGGDGVNFSSANNWAPNGLPGSGDGTDVLDKVAIAGGTAPAGCTTNCFITPTQTCLLRDQS